MRVEVRNNNIDAAIRILKKKMQQDGLFNEMRNREAYESKGEKRRRKAAAGRQRWLKEQQKRLEEYGF
jgi:small subunit ribosomal protein S21|tara:strand:- start:1683 stop:1886 length:204 start_codon:yes stop_codon:yes gene_type:complete